MEIPIVRLGNAKMTCNNCQKDVQMNMTMKYLFESVMRLQTGNQFVMRCSYNKLQLAEGILGILARFKVKEVKREVVKIDGKDYTDILVGV